MAKDTGNPDVHVIFSYMLHIFRPLNRKIRQHQAGKILGKTTSHNSTYEFCQRERREHGRD